METQDSLLLEIFGIKAAANGQFAIAATLLVLLLAGLGFAAGRSRKLW
jgi:hypothetical protein